MHRGTAVRERGVRQAHPTGKIKCEDTVKMDVSLLSPSPASHTKRATPGKSRDFPQGNPHGPELGGACFFLGWGKKSPGSWGQKEEGQPDEVMQHGVSLQKGCSVLDSQPQSWALARPHARKMENPWAWPR